MHIFHNLQQEQSVVNIQMSYFNLKQHFLVTFRSIPTVDAAKGDNPVHSPFTKTPDSGITSACPIRMSTAKIQMKSTHIFVQIHHKTLIELQSLRHE